LGARAENLETDRGSTADNGPGIVTAVGQFNDESDRFSGPKRPARVEIRVRRPYLRIDDAELHRKRARIFPRLVVTAPGNGQPHQANDEDEEMTSCCDTPNAGS
jgi:hypothetical protein